MGFVSLGFKTIVSALYFSEYYFYYYYVLLKIEYIIDFYLKIKQGRYPPFYNFMINNFRQG